MRGYWSCTDYDLLSRNDDEDETARTRHSQAIAALWPPWSGDVWETKDVAGAETNKKAPAARRCLIFKWAIQDLNP